MMFACKKDDPLQEEDCQARHVGYLTITNQSSNPYDVWIDNTLVGRLGGQQFVSEMEIAAGTRSVRAKQVSGYVLYPTEVLKTISVNSCQKLSFVFP